MTIEAPHMPGMPGDQSGPVFREPWHAEAFSLAVALHRQGAFTWSEWVEIFSGTLRDVAADSGEGVESAYYRRWLLALEGIVARKHLTSVEEMAARKEEWRRAYLRTPHGEPVELQRGLVIGPHLHEPLPHAGDDHHHTGRPEPVAVSPERSSGATRLSF